MVSRLGPCGRPGSGETRDAGGAQRFAVGNLVIDHAARRVFLDGEQCSLSPREYWVLHTLARHAGRMVPHAELLRRAWGEEYVGETHYVAVYVARLRAKLEGRGHFPRIKIESVRGEGYRLIVEPHAAFADQPCNGSGEAA